MQHISRKYFGRYPQSLESEMLENIKPYLSKHSKLGYTGTPTVRLGVFPRINISAAGSETRFFPLCGNSGIPECSFRQIVLQERKSLRELISLCFCWSLACDAASWRGWWLLLARDGAGPAIAETQRGGRAISRPAALRMPVQARHRQQHPKRHGQERKRLRSHTLFAGVGGCGPRHCSGCE